MGQSRSLIFFLTPEMLILEKFCNSLQEQLQGIPTEEGSRFDFDLLFKNNANTTNKSIKKTIYVCLRFKLIYLIVLYIYIF